MLLDSGSRAVEKEKKQKVPTNAPGSESEEGDRAERISGEVREGFCNRWLLCEAKNVGHPIPESRHHLGGSGFADGAFVFTEDDIANVMKGIFDFPMAPDQGDKAFGRSLLPREACDSVDDPGVKGLSRKIRHMAFDPKDLLMMGKRRPARS